MTRIFPGILAIALRNGAEIATHKMLIMITMATDVSQKNFIFKGNDFYIEDCDSLTSVLDC